MAIGKKIFELRTQKQITQKQLADMCGFSQSALNLWENEKRQPKIEQLYKIAYALEIPVIDLVGIEGIMKRSEDILKKFKIEHKVDNSLSQENQLLNLYNTLNVDGQKKAIEQVELLTKIPEYKKDPEPPAL